MLSPLIWIKNRLNKCLREGVGDEVKKDHQKNFLLNSNRFGIAWITSLFLY